MQKVIYTNARGESIVFGRDSPYRLVRVDTPISTNSVDTKIIGMDGQDTLVVNYNPRSIVLSLAIHGVTGGKLSYKELYRLYGELGKVVLPHQTGTLTYKNDGGVYQITCRPVMLPSLEDFIGSIKRLEIDFAANKPYWLSQFEQKQPLGQVVDGKRYPLKYPLRFGTWVKNAEIVNDTNVTTPMIIEITSTALYITVTNQTTGEYITVDSPLTASQTMVIDTDKCTVEIITYDELGQETAREYANQKLALGSRYITLAPGKNIITIDNGYPGSKPSAVVRYYKRYLVV